MKRQEYENIKIYTQKNVNVKNVKEYVRKVNTYIKDYKVTSNRNVHKKTNKRNKEEVYKNNKYNK